MADRAVVLTGASGGIGVALTDYLLSSGVSRLLVQYRTESPQLFDTLERHGVDPVTNSFRADLSVESSVAEFGEYVRAMVGAPWGVINLAGASSNDLSWKLSMDDFQKVVASSLTTTFLVCREFVPGMREAGGGRIINTSSVVAFSGAPGAAHYAAAKAGVVGFTKSIAKELAARQITANVLALGYFEYGMLYTVPEDLRESIRQQIPTRRFGTASEIGATCRHLLGEESAYTTGQVLHINGGLYS